MTVNAPSDAESARADKTKASMGSVPSGASGGLVYCLGVIGSAVYYIQAASTFGEGVVGVLKALVWPGFLVYDLLRFLHA